MNEDVTIRLDMNDGHGPRNISPDTFAQLPAAFQKFLHEELRAVGDQLRLELEQIMEKEYRERPRDDGMDLTIDRIRQAMTKWTAPATSGMLSVNVFNLEKIQELTSQLGDHINDPGYFELFEDGHPGYEHVSTKYGFISLEFAEILAAECGESMNLTPSRREELLSYVREKFRGKHGDGIMTRLDAPLFLAYPEFGTARQNGVHPFGGFKSKGALDKAPVGRLFFTVMNKAMERLASMI